MDSDVAPIRRRVVGYPAQWITLDSNVLLPLLGYAKNQDSDDSAQSGKSSLKSKISEYLNGHPANLFILDIVKDETFHNIDKDNDINNKNKMKHDLEKFATRSFPNTICPSIDRIYRNALDEPDSDLSKAWIARKLVWLSKRRNYIPPVDIDILHDDKDEVLKVLYDDAENIISKLYSKLDTDMKIISNLINLASDTNVVLLTRDADMLVFADEIFEAVGLWILHPHAIYLSSVHSRWDSALPLRRLMLLDDANIEDLLKYVSDKTGMSVERVKLVLSKMDWDGKYCDTLEKVFETGI